MSISPTNLLYMTNMFQFESPAEVIDIISWNDENKAVVVDQTIFYPQGGGQPFDQGVIKSDSAQFDVQEVRFKDGIVYHIGRFKDGKFDKGGHVNLIVNEQRRLLNSRLHTAGHIIDIAMTNLGYNLTPGKGYHFPKGSYVEFLETLDQEERERLLPVLQKEINKIIEASLPITVKNVSGQELHNVSKFVPDYIPKDKPSRAMIIQGFHAIPCGGTHVANTQDVKSVIVEKIKNRKGNLRISYSLD